MVVHRRLLTDAVIFESRGFEPLVRDFFSADIQSTCAKGPESARMENG
jgi:hypothetical protein